MKSSKRWLWQQSNFVDGCNAVQLDSWRSLYDFLSRHGYTYPRYLFRGQSRQSDMLISPLARLEYDRNKRHHYLEHFKRTLQGRLTLPQEPLSERDLWVLGYTAGLHTPLLSWTQAAYIAAFFAFYPERRINLPANALLKDFKAAKQISEEGRAIYILNREVIEEARKKFRLAFVRRTYPKLHEKLKQLTGNLVAFNDPYYLDHYIDGILQHGTNVCYSTKLISACETATHNRDHFMLEIFEPNTTMYPLLLSQSCIFTYCPQDISIDDWIREHFAGSHQDVLLKITIPDSDRDECLQTLHQMNITPLTLFPNLNGSAQYCNDLLNNLYQHNRP